MAVTLKQIAERASCSIMTVSNVLNDRGDLYREAMRNRVLTAARELGYRPNASARATRRGRFGNITLLSSINFRQSNLPMGLIGGIEAALADNELTFSFARLPDERLRDPAYMYRVLRRWSADGLLVNYTHGYPKELRAFIHEFSIPAVWINCRLEADCVYPDDVEAGRIATQALIDQGRRKIAFVDYVAGWDELDKAHYSILDRQTGYETAMAEAGLEPRVIRGAKHVSSADRHEAVYALLSRPDRPEAVVAYSGVQAMGTAAASLGMTIPDDLPIIGFGDTAVQTGFGTVDSVIIPQEELGAVAVEHLLKKVQRPKQPLPPRSIQPRLVAATDAEVAVKRGEIPVMRTVPAASGRFEERPTAPGPV